MRVKVRHGVALVLVETLVQRVMRHGCDVERELQCVQWVDQRFFHGAGVLHQSWAWRVW